MVGLFAAFGFLSKYLFVYLLASIDLLFIYLIFIKKDRKFDFKYLITLEVFLIALVPHLIWLNNNEFITITYGLARTGLEQSSLIDHIKFPLIFLLKQIGLLIPFLVLVWLLVKKIKFKFDFKDKKLLFLFNLRYSLIMLQFYPPCYLIMLVSCNTNFNCYIGIKYMQLGNRGFTWSA